MRTGRLVGIQPIKDVFLMEYHSQAYSFWRRTKNRILVHLDAHMDFGWRPERHISQILEIKTIKSLNRLLNQSSVWEIGQRGREGLAIYLALKNKILKEFWWVVPDKEWGTQRERRNIEKLIRHIPVKKRIITEGKRIIIKIDNMRVITCRLQDLPQFKESILLDIDLDFLVIKSVFKADASCSGSPWIKPDELVSKLTEKKIRTDLVTIACSIKQGFTPAKYKSLGDKLASILKHPNKYFS